MWTTIFALTTEQIIIVVHCALVDNYPLQGCHINGPRSNLANVDNCLCFDYRADMVVHCALVDNYPVQGCHINGPRSSPFFSETGGEWPCIVNTK